MIHEIKHSKWGSNLDNQIEALAYRELGNDGIYNRKKGLFFDDMEYVGSGWVPTNNDHDDAKRQYKHQCDLLKIVVTPHHDGPMLVVFLDGHVTSSFMSSEMELRFAPEELGKNDGKPIAEVWFYGTGTRRGPLERYGTSRIICTFANKEQMEEYICSENKPVKKPDNGFNVILASPV